MYMGGGQNHGPLLGPLNTRCRIILRTQTGTIILTTSHMWIYGVFIRTVMIVSDMCPALWGCLALCRIGGIELTGVWCICHPTYKELRTSHGCPWALICSCLLCVCVYDFLFDYNIPANMEVCSASGNHGAYSWVEDGRVQGFTVDSSTFGG